MKFPNSVTIPTQVMARQVGDETVLLDLASGNYYGLDAVGARVWQLLGDGLTLPGVCDTLLNEYATTREELEGDLERLVRELSDQGLVTVS